MQLHRLRLKVLRAERELSQEAVATQTGMKTARYWYLETKGGIATKTEVKAIAAVLGVPARTIAVDTSAVAQ